MPSKRDKMWRQSLSRKYLPWRISSQLFQNSSIGKESSSCQSLIVWELMQWSKNESLVMSKLTMKETVLFGMESLVSLSSREIKRKPIFKRQPKSLKWLLSNFKREAMRRRTKWSTARLRFLGHLILSSSSRSRNIRNRPREISKTWPKSLGLLRKKADNSWIGCSLSRETEQMSTQHFRRSSRS